MATKSEILKEALFIASEALRELELSEAPLTSIALKASRIARITGDFDMQQIMLFEAGGYPSEPTGVQSEIWSLAVKAKRIVKEKKEGKINEYAILKSIEQLESENQAAKERLRSAVDPNISISSNNPNQFISPVVGNGFERTKTVSSISETAKVIGQRRAYIYQYLSDVYYELRYSSVTEDSFSRIRSVVDINIANLTPNAVKKFTAIYDNLDSDNTEDWANAVHSCRRVLQDLADVLYPSRADITKNIGGKERIIKLGPDAYINRIIAYVEENTQSERFKEIVGSHIKYLGERLDAIFQAAQKGSHAEIVSKEEADRYVVYTYMVVGDLITLKLSRETSPSQA